MRDGASNSRRVPARAQFESPTQGEFITVFIATCELTCRDRLMLGTPAPDSRIKPASRRPQRGLWYVFTTPPRADTSPPPPPPTAAREERGRGRGGGGKEKERGREGN